MRFFIGFLVVDLTLGVGFGVATALLFLFDTIRGESTSDAVGWPVVIGMAALIAVALCVVEWRLFKRWYKPCPACTSFVPTAATRCRYCTMDFDGGTG